jgi:hypothetical protein
MFRKILVIPVLLVALAGCGTSNTATTAGGVAETSSSPTSMAQAADCPTAPTKKFAKTRFVADAGLAFGAFHRYIYKPYKAGAFKSGAPSQKKAIVKAAAAAVFTLNRLNAARKLVGEDPTLCKTLKAPLDALGSMISGMVGKLKGGNVDPGQLDSVSSAIDGIKKNASGSGMNIQDK